MATALYAAPLGYPRFYGFNPTTGAPLAGGTVNIFQAGTSTPDSGYPTYADGIAGTNGATIYTLDAAGGATIFLQAGRFYKIILKDSAGVTVFTVDSVGPANGSAFPTLTEWTTQAGTLTFVGATQFKYTGVDLTGVFHVGRRVRTINTGGTIYGTVSAVAFSAGDTTVTVVNDSGVIDSGISAAAFGMTSYINPSYLDPRTALSVVKGANQTGFATSTKVITWNIIEDALSEWVAGSHRWVAKYPGQYEVTVSVNLSDTSANQRVLVTLCKNGSLIAQMADYTHTTANLDTTKTFTWRVRLVATDFLEVFLTGTANTTVVFANNATLFTVARIP